jgi:hypothetical protein
VHVFRTISAISLLTLCFNSVAQAVSVKNLDEADLTITIVEGASSKDVSLKSGASVDGICLKGCLIKLKSDQDPYELEGGEVTSIEDGVLWGEPGPATPNGDGPTSGPSTDKKP